MVQPFRSSRSREELSRLLRATGGWITVEHAATVLGLDRQAAAKRLARWAEQGWLKRVQRGHYAPIPLERTHPDAPLEEPWTVVPHLLPRGYVGGWTAAHHWDLTEQIFRDVCVFAPGRTRRLERGGATYAVFPAPSNDRLGLRTHWLGSIRVPISDAARTLVDMLAQPRAGPGIQHAADCLATYARAADASLDRLLDYADRIGNGAVFKRMGFLVERAALGTPEWLEACRAVLTQGLAKLDPSVPCPRVVTRWRLRVPESWVGRDDD
jgi:predicted transcriptional regulator of viral defense system